MNMDTSSNIEAVVNDAKLAPLVVDVNLFFCDLGEVITFVLKLLCIDKEGSEMLTLIIKIRFV